MTELEENNRYLIFSVGNEKYGVPLFDVREVVKYQNPKFIPNTHKQFSGVINLRGSIVGVVSFRTKFGLPDEVGPRSAMLVCDTEQGPIAAVVDHVEAVVGLSEDLIDRNPPIQSKIAQSFLTGVARQKEDLITLVQLTKLLSEEQFVKESA